MVKLGGFRFFGKAPEREATWGFFGRSFVGAEYLRFVLCLGWLAVGWRGPATDREGWPPAQRWDGQSIGRDD